MQGINLYMETVVQDLEFLEQLGARGSGGASSAKKAYIVLETWDYDQMVHQSVSHWFPRGVFISSCCEQ